jgi:hypothetical protein
VWIHKRPEILKTGPFRSVGQMKNHKMSADMEAGVQLIKLSWAYNCLKKQLRVSPQRRLLALENHPQKMLKSSIEATCGCIPASLDWNR